MSEMSRQLFYLKKHTDICKHSTIRAQELMVGNRVSEKIWYTGGYRKEMENEEVKQKKRAYIAIRKQEELWHRHGLTPAGN